MFIKAVWVAQAVRLKSWSLEGSGIASPSFAAVCDLKEGGQVNHTAWDFMSQMCQVKHAQMFSIT